MCLALASLPALACYMSLALLPTLFRRFSGSLLSSPLARHMPARPVNLLSLVAAAVQAANEAADVVRDVMRGGNLGIVHKVCIVTRHSCH